MGLRLLGITVVLVAFATPVIGLDGTPSGRKQADTPTTVKQPAAVADQTESRPTSIGMAALQDAAKAGKYLFIFFHKDDGEQTQRLRAIFDAALQKVADKAMPVVVDINDPREREIVDKYKVSRAPMPFVFAVAPNGAIVRSHRLRFTEAQLVSSFASPGLEKALKSLQDGKMTFVCVQNGHTKFDAEAMKGINEFTSDPQYTATTGVVKIDPSDAAEAEFLKNLKVDPETSEAVTVLLTPPGKTVATFKGATEKKVLLASVKNATKKKPCCPGKKGGCKPKKKGE